MKEEKLQNKIDFLKNKKLEVEIALKELESLSNNENVIRFLKLLEYDTSENRELVLMKDKEIEELAKKKLENEEKVYFCLGRGFSGFQRKDGSYMILARSFDDYRVLAHYININDTSDEYIIPKDDTDEFESSHNVIFSKSYDYYCEFDELIRKYKDDLVSHGKEKAMKIVLEKYK